MERWKIWFTPCPKTMLIWPNTLGSTQVERVKTPWHQENLLFLLINSFREFSSNQQLQERWSSIDNQEGSQPSRPKSAFSLSLSLIQVCNNTSRDHAKELPPRWSNTSLQFNYVNPPVRSSLHSPSSLVSWDATQKTIGLPTNASTVPTDSSQSWCILIKPFYTKWRLN